MRPRHLYSAIYTWSVLSGGRFTAPFLQNVAHFSDTLTGLALALQVGLVAFLGSFSGALADYLEHRYPHRGRVYLMSFGVFLGTVAFCLHGVVHILFGEGSSSNLETTFHMLLRVAYSLGKSFVMPVLDGITLAFLEEEGRSQADYGKERLYGAVGVAVASALIGPFIDRFGFEVMFAFSVLAALLCFLVVIVYVKESGDDETKRTLLISADSASTKVETRPCNGGEVVGSYLQSYPEKVGHKRFWILLKLMCGTVYGASYIFSCLTLSMGISVVENLIFLFFESLGGSNSIMGLTVVVTVVFELPIFYIAPTLLKQFGSGGLQKIACAAYVIRVVGYTFIPPHRLALVLFLEPLHGVTSACEKTSRVDYIAKFCPKGYEASGQGIMEGLVGFGYVVGLSAGGWAEDALGPHAMYTAFAVVVSIGLLVFLFADILENEAGTSDAQRQGYQTTDTDEHTAEKRAGACRGTVLQKLYQNPHFEIHPSNATNNYMYVNNNER